MPSLTTLLLKAGGVLFVSFLVCLILCLNLMGTLNFWVLEYEVVSDYSVIMSLTMVVDWWSMIFISVVLLISACVMIFSELYMGNSNSVTEFTVLLLMFILSMILLVLMPNLISLMLGWDGLGVVSFLLVIFYKSKDALSAGLLTILINRVGDVILLISISVMGSLGHWDLVSVSEEQISSVLIFLVVFGGMTKSAQVPFSAWLPAAMAAPTPVSSLVHSSTLVTAGVYLLLRFAESLTVSSKLMLLVLSVITMVMAGFSATVECDVKKLIALSTLSQLGMMMMILCVGGLNICLFHLMSHALFKSTMFLSAGAVIYALSGIQDIRHINGLYYKMPVVSSWFMVSSGSMMALPFMSGFYSKELIIDFCLESPMSMLSLLSLMGSVCLTCLYSLNVMGKILFLKGDCSSVFYKLESVKMIGPISCLGVGAIYGSFMMEKMVSKFSQFVFIMPFYKVSVFMLLFFSLLALGAKFYLKKDFKEVSLSKMLFMAAMWKKILFLSLISAVPFKKMSEHSSEVVNKLDKGWIMKGMVMEGVESSVKMVIKTYFRLTYKSLFAFFMGCILVASMLIMYYMWFFF